MFNIYIIYICILYINACIHYICSLYKYINKYVLYNKYYIHFNSEYCLAFEERLELGKCRLFRLVDIRKKTLEARTHDSVAVGNYRRSCCSLSSSFFFGL